MEPSYTKQDPFILGVCCLENVHIVALTILLVVVGEPLNHLQGNCNDLLYVDL